ncbi:MAG: gamma-glutamylcyclotransferase family protein [Gammaproteobacteria bacterium]
MPVSVFTYGTLQVPTVMTAVTGQSFPYQPALLPGYRRYQIKNRVYPAIVPDESASTPGVLYNDINDEALALLDEFEDVLYDRLQVVVQQEGKPVNAYAYVIAAKYMDRLASHDWDLSEFERQHLDYYLQRIEQL